MITRVLFCVSILAQPMYCAEPSSAVECLHLFLENAESLRENYALCGRASLTLYDKGNAIERSYAWHEFHIQDSVWYRETSVSHLGVKEFSNEVRSRRLCLGDEFFVANPSRNANRSLVRFKPPAGLDTESKKLEYWHQSDLYRMPNPLTCCLVGNTIFTVGKDRHENLVQLVHRSMQIIDQAPTDSGFRGQWVTPGAVLEVEFDKSDNYMPSRVSGHYKKTEFNYEVAKPTPKDLGEPFCQINTKWFELDEGIMAPISILNSVARVHPKKKQAQDLELIAVWRHGAAKEEDFSLSNLNGDRSNLIKLQESIIAEMKKLHGK